MGDVSIDIRALKELKDQIDEAVSQMDNFCSAVAKDLAGRLLNKVIKRTPVGVKPDVSDKVAQDHWSGYQGGTLRKNWTASPVTKSGAEYVVEVTNNVVYASYVEYGHRQEIGRFVPQLGKRLKKGFVEGKFMLRISEQEIREQAPAFIERKIDTFLKGAFNGK